MKPKTCVVLRLTFEGIGNSGALAGKVKHIVYLALKSYGYENFTVEVAEHSTAYEVEAHA